MLLSRDATEKKLEDPPRSSFGISRPPIFHPKKFEGPPISPPPPLQLKLWLVPKSLRFIFYHPRSTDFEEKIEGMWTGHLFEEFKCFDRKLFAFSALVLTWFMCLFQKEFFIGFRQRYITCLVSLAWAARLIICKPFLFSSSLVHKKAVVVPGVPSLLHSRF